MLAPFLKESFHPIFSHELAGKDAVARKELSVEELSAVVELARIETSVKLGHNLLSILELDLISLCDCLRVKHLELMRHEIILKSLVMKHRQEDGEDHPQTKVERPDIANHIQ